MRIAGLLRFQQQGDEIAAHEINAVEIDRDQLAPFLGCEIGDRRDEVVAGVVDHRLGAPPFLGDEVAESSNVGLVRNVRREHLGLAPAFLDRQFHLIELGLGPRHENDGCAEFGQRLGGRAADPGSGAGDHHHFAVELHLLQQVILPLPDCRVPLTPTCVVSGGAERASPGADAIIPQVRPRRVPNRLRGCAVTPRRVPPGRRIPCRSGPEGRA